MKLKFVYGVGKWNETKIEQASGKKLWFILAYIPETCEYNVVVKDLRTVPTFNDQLIAYNIKMSDPVDDVVYVLILNQDLHQNCMWTRKYTDVTCYYVYRVGLRRVCVLRLYVST